MKTPLLVLAALALPAATLLAQQDRFVQFPSGPRVNFTVPLGYSLEAKENSDGSVGIKMENPVWGITIYAIIAAETDPKAATREWQEDKLIGHISTLLSQAAESDYDFQPLTPAKGTGVYCTFSAPDAGSVGSDEPPPPGTSPFATGGIKTWPGRAVLFHIFSNSLTSEEYQEAFYLFSWSFTE